MSTRGKKLLELVTSKNKNLLDLPKYETTKGSSCEEQLTTLKLFNESHIINQDYSNEELFSSDTEYIPDTSESEEEEIQEEDNLSIPKKNNNHSSKVEKSTIHSFAKFEASTSKVEQFTNTRPWTKKNACPYCFREFTHFPRHLERNHKDEAAVKKILSLSFKNPERRKMLNAIRREGNFILHSKTNIVRPVRRQKGQYPEEIIPNSKNFKNQYVACQSCLGYYSRNYLRRHRKVCPLRREFNQGREQHLSSAQFFAICSGPHRDFYANLRLKEEVFPIMRNDEFSRTAMEDTLICSYADTLLRKHKRPQIKNVISNKMRELGRLLVTLKSINGVESLFDALKPDKFQNIVSATKVISGYNPETRWFKASSLALHMGTTLKQVCDVANKLIIEKSCLLPCTDQEICLLNINRLRQLIESHWNTELASLALKNLNENKYNKPKILPVTSDVIKFETYVTKRAKQAQLLLDRGNINETEYRKLLECVLGLTLLLNRKRIGEIEHLTIKTYNNMQAQTQQEEFLEGLTESEKMLTKSFKRVVTLGKGSKPVPILFSIHLQELINVLLNVRHLYVPESNEYLFANQKTNNQWLNGYQTLKKLAQESDVSDASLFTSTRLRKQIATILQVLNITDSEMEQFAAFLGHTKKTHENYYRLPQDIYQTAKVSKLLLAINSGKGHMYKGKSLDQIEFSDNLDTDSDSEDKKLPTKKRVESGTSQEKENNSKGKKNKNNRIPWTEDEKVVLKNFFKNHIKKRQSPRKHEVEELISQHQELFKNRNWVLIKAFVYNFYKQKTEL